MEITARAIQMTPVLVFARQDRRVYLPAAAQGVVCVWNPLWPRSVSLMASTASSRGIPECFIFITIIYERGDCANRWKD
jgi:hypothetical protein